MNTLKNILVPLLSEKAMDNNDKSFNDTVYNINTIPENIVGDELEDVDDKSMREQRKARFSQDTRFRKHLANWVMIIVPSWLFLVIVILFFAGFNLLKLQTEVLITLLATTTVNVLGLAYIVLKGIFPESK